MTPKSLWFSLPGSLTACRRTSLKCCLKHNTSKMEIIIFLISLVVFTKPNSNLFDIPYIWQHSHASVLLRQFPLLPFHDSPLKQLLNSNLTFKTQVKRHQFSKVFPNIHSTASHSNLGRWIVPLAHVCCTFLYSMCYFYLCINYLPSRTWAPWGICFIKSF